MKTTDAWKAKQAEIGGQAEMEFWSKVYAIPEVDAAFDQARKGAINEDQLYKVMMDHALVLMHSNCKLPPSRPGLASDKLEWLVDIKDSRPHSWEISVLRSDNIHGIKSYGWFDEHKVFIGSIGSPNEFPILPEVWDELVAMAGRICDRLNSGEIKT